MNDTMNEGPVLLAVDDGVATVTLNRPDKLNALNRELLESLAEVVAACERRDDVAAVVLTGSGDKAFAAGADIGELAAMGPVEAGAYARFGQSIFDRLERLPKPVIAAVNGFALGGGCELAMAAHMRVAADKASFGQPEVKLGLIPGFAGTQRLTRLVGKARALELLLTGDHVRADRALEMGLVNRVVPQAEVVAAARELAQAIRRVAPRAVQYALDAVHGGLEAGFAEGCRLEATLFGLLFSTADMKEGTRAFLDKRAAAFSGE